METNNFHLNQSLSIEELETRQELSVATIGDSSLEEVEAAAMAKCKSAEAETSAE
jgi:hypothetical protein